MKKKGNKDDTKSRREFFKKAAINTLPIIGVLTLSNTPFTGHAINAIPHEFFTD